LNDWYLSVDPVFMNHAHRGLHHAAAVACGVVAALTIYIVFTVLGIELNQLWSGVKTSTKEQFTSALVWWSVVGASLVSAWLTRVYLTVVVRKSKFVYRLGQRFLLIVIFGVATGGGVLSKGDGISGIASVIGGLTGLGLSVVCAYCGARLVFLNANT
jgi:hypothetical protein